MEETYYYEFELEPVGTVWGFDDYSHFFTEDKDVIYLKPIYLLPAPGFPDSNLFKQKLIGEGRYINLLYIKHPLGYRVNSSRWIKNYLISLGAREAPARFQDGFSSRFFAIERKKVIRQIAPRECVQEVMVNNEKIRRIVRELSLLFELPITQLGITGSLSIGAKTYNDIDIVIYGTTEEICRIKKIMIEQQKCYGPVLEDGKMWPCRFRDKHGNVICCFFNYTDQVYTNILRNLLTIIETSQMWSTFDEIIIDDTYSFAKTPLYRLSGTQYDLLLVLSRESRGRLHKGDHIVGNSIWGYTDDHRKMLVVFDPYQEITLCKDL